MSSWKSLLGYHTVPTDLESEQAELKDDKHAFQKIPSRGSRQYSFVFVCIVGLAALAIGFLAGSFFATPGVERADDQLEGTAPQVQLATIKRAFNFSTAFTDPPPQEEGLQNISEPIWDSLIPRGLGYFKDEDVSSHISIPTVFHSLHCLYTLRRAYYATSDDPARFDLGKNRKDHVPHCFDYLQQALTCSADSTAEPAIDHERGFLGSGFQRQCRDFEGLKSWVEERRVFNATGFLADGLHGHAVGE